MAAGECSSYCRIYYDLLPWILVILLHYRVLTVRRSGNGHLVPSSCLVRPTMCCVSFRMQQSTATHSINTTQSNQQPIWPSSSKNQTSLTSGAGKLQMRVRRPNATSARRTPSANESPLQQGTATNSSNMPTSSWLHRMRKDRIQWPTAPTPPPTPVSAKCSP